MAALKQLKTSWYSSWNENLDQINFIFKVQSKLTSVGKKSSQPKIVSTKLYSLQNCYFRKVLADQQVQDPTISGSPANFSSQTKWDTESLFSFHKHALDILAYRTINTSYQNLRVYSSTWCFSQQDTHSLQGTTHRISYAFLCCVHTTTAYC